MFKCLDNFLMIKKMMIKMMGKWWPVNGCVQHHIVNVCLVPNLLRTVSANEIFKSTDVSFYTNTVKTTCRVKILIPTLLNFIYYLFIF